MVCVIKLEYYVSAIINECPDPFVPKHVLCGSVTDNDGVYVVIRDDINIQLQPYAQTKTRYKEVI